MGDYKFGDNYMAFHEAPPTEPPPASGERLSPLCESMTIMKAMPTLAYTSEDVKAGIRLKIELKNECGKGNILLSKK